jgi:hypothetical protein
MNQIKRASMLSAIAAMLAWTALGAVCFHYGDRNTRQLFSRYFGHRPER